MAEENKPATESQNNINGSDGNKAGDDVNKTVAQMTNGDEKPKEGDEKPKEGDEKPKEGDEKPKEGDEKPKEYEPFIMPEGMQVDTAVLNKFAPVLLKYNVPQEGAQELANIFAAVREEDTKATLAFYKGLRDEAMALPEEQRVLAKRAMMLDPELGAQIEEDPYLGNSALFFKIMSIFGKKMQEGVFIEGRETGDNDKSPEAEAKRFYSKK